MITSTDGRIIWPALARSLSERHPDILTGLREMIEETDERGDTLSRKFTIGRSQVSASILLAQDSTALIHVMLRLGEMSLSTSFLHGMTMPDSIAMTLVGRPLRDVVDLDLIPQDVVIKDVTLNGRGHRIAHDWSKHNEIRSIGSE